MPDGLPTPVGAGGRWLRRRPGVGPVPRHLQVLPPQGLPGGDGNVGQAVLRQVLVQGGLQQRQHGVVQRGEHVVQAVVPEVRQRQQQPRAAAEARARGRGGQLHQAEVVVRPQRVALVVVVGVVVAGAQALVAEVEAADDQHPGPQQPGVQQRGPRQQHARGHRQRHRVRRLQPQVQQPLAELAVAEHGVHDDGVAPRQVAHDQVLARVRQERDEGLEKRHLQVLKRIGEDVVRERVAHHPLPGRHEAELEVEPPPVVLLVEEVVRRGGRDRHQDAGHGAEHEEAPEVASEGARQQRGRGQHVHDGLGALLGGLQNRLGGVVQHLPHPLP